MQSLGIKKFLLDYVIGFGLMFLLFYLLIGNLTVMDTRGVLLLPHACSSEFSAEDVLQAAQDSLRSGERCEVILPCVDAQALQCEGTVKASGLIKTILRRDLLIISGLNTQ